MPALRHVLAAVTLLSLFVLTSHAADADTDYRIPTTFRVVDQAVSLKLDPDQAGYSGSTTLRLRVDEATDSLTLHWIDLKVPTISLEGNDGTRVLEASPAEWDMFKLSDGSTIKEGEYSLTLEFEGEYSEDALGLYKATEDGINYLFTQYEMTLARRVFPMVDEPDTKIPWSVTISAPAALKVAANTPVASSTTEAGWTTRVFKKTKPMPSYLLALTVGDFDVTPIANMPMPSVIYSPKGQSGGIGYSARVTPAILKALEDYFGSAYPYEKLDFVAVPNFTFGAMENAGLVTYRTELLLNGDNPAPTSAVDTVNVIAHELAHQWYGNLVTMAWWDDLWLNEAFATWMAYRVTTELHPEFLTELHMPQRTAFRSDSLGATGAIRQVVRQEEDIVATLGLNYTKGHALLNMLEQAMGRDAFRAGIRDYMQKHQWGNTIASDLWASLGKHANYPVGEVAETFLNQPGFPLIRIGEDGTLSQRRYENLGANLPEQSWQVPMSLLVSRDDKVSSTTLLLTETEQRAGSIAGADWILPTAGGNGYFTWYTDPVRYNNLLNSLDALTDREKQAVLVNGQRLLSGGVVDMGQHMALIGKMAQQDNEEIVLKAVDALLTVAQMYRGTHIEPAVQVWVADTLTPWYEKLGATPRATDNQGAVKLRARVLRALAQQGNSEPVLKDLAIIADAYLKDPKSVDGSIALEALRMNAMFFGDKTVAQRYVDAYRSTKDAVQKTAIRRSMYFTDDEAVETVMASLGDGAFNAGDMISVIFGLFYANTDQSVLYQFYNANHDKIVSKLPEFYVPTLPTYTSAGCSNSNMAAQKAFYGERGDIYSTSLKKNRETVQNCINTKNREIDAVEAYLEAG